MTNPQNIQTTLSTDLTGGLGEIQFFHPPGTFVLTPASRIAIQTVCQHQDLLTGQGLDWGSGTGCLAITAAKIETVKQVVGLEISAANMEIARQNALRNGVCEKVAFLLSDSYTPYSEQDRRRLETFVGKTQFILANPPSSEGDDGFEYRRVVLQGARKYLVKGGIVFLNISTQYGQQRVDRLSQQVPGFFYGGVLASSDWLPFDLQRPDLLHSLELYVQEEQRNGLKYIFQHPKATDAETYLNAQGALHYFQQTGQSPLTKWQSHLFRYLVEDRL